VGIANAAVWFGAAIFFTLGIGPSVFSQDMHRLLGEQAFPLYSGEIALIFIKRYFILQYFCGLIALLHLSGEFLYLGRKPSRLRLALLMALFALGLLGGVWLQPRMRALHQTMYYGATAEQKEAARRSFNTWHGISQTGNLLIICGLAVYLMRVARPAEAGRYSTIFTKFRG
jgi:hypothetical protein